MTWWRRVRAPEDRAWWRGHGLGLLGGELFVPAVSKFAVSTRLPGPTYAGGASSLYLECFASTFFAKRQQWHPNERNRRSGGD